MFKLSLIGYLNIFYGSSVLCQLGFVMFKMSAILLNGDPGSQAQNQAHTERGVQFQMTYSALMPLSSMSKDSLAIILERSHSALLPL